MNTQRPIVALALALSLTLVLGPLAIAGARDAKGKATFHAVAGPVTLNACQFDGEDGVQVVHFSCKDKFDDDEIKPGELRVVLFIHNTAKAGETLRFKPIDSAKTFKAIFQGTVKAGAFLIDNREGKTKVELGLKELVPFSADGGHIRIRESTFKKGFKAEFALLGKTGAVAGAADCKR